MIDKDTLPLPSPERPQSEQDYQQNDGTWAEPANPYRHLSREHEALVRRLHRERCHPDYEYRLISFKFDKIAGVKLVITPVFDIDTAWEENEDFHSHVNELSTQSGRAGPTTIEHCFRRLKSQ